MIRSFSVIVPVFNKEAAIVATLESIEASIAFFQAKDPRSPEIAAEVVIVDEGSHDRTPEFIQAFIQDKPHYQVIHHFKGLGAGPARNTGAKVSKGDLLFFCDGDDLFHKEHIYLCLQAFTNAGESNSPIALEGMTVARPSKPIGMVKTGVKMQDELHPYWKTAIENSIPINMCVLRECHEFIEGFPESIVYKKLGNCEDIAYFVAMVKFFRHAKLNAETVEYVRYPGNNFDKQLKKFQTAPEEYHEDTPIAEKELHAIRHKLETDHLNYLLNKFRKVDLSPEMAATVNWDPLVREYVNQQDYVGAIALGETGFAAQPSDGLRNLLAVAYNNAGSALHQQGDSVQAGHYFQRAIDLEPEIPQTDLARLYFNVGAALRDQEQWIAALSCIEKSLELDSTLAPAQATLPIVQYKAKVRDRGYEFTQDWFSHNIPIWTAHLAGFRDQPIKALEIGSWEGRSSCWLLDTILTHESARLTCVDTFEGAVEHQAMGDRYLSEVERRFDGNIEKAGATDRVRKMIGASQSVLRSLIPDTYDLAYIDGSHVASDVLEDTILTWRLVKVGGIIIFDDYGFRFAEAIDEQTPKVAIDAFLTMFAKKVKLIHQGYQVIIEKIAE